MIAGGESQKNLQKEINAAGVGDRIYFIPRMSYFDHIARIKHVDICLDVPNLGGSASLVDCLMSGAIPVTYEGKQFASRFGSSLLTDIGLGELCANSFEAYWGLICRLISDSQWRTFMREKINALLVQRHKFELSSQAASWKSILEKVISQ